MKEVPSGSSAVISLPPKKYFFPFPSIKTYSQCLHTKSTKIGNSWLSNDVKCSIQMGRACLYIRNLFHIDKQIKSNLIFQRFWALSIVQATSTCLANGTLASTVPQGDLTIVGIRSFPPNIYNCTSNMDIMTTTSSLSTAKQIEHRLLLSEKVILINKNIKHPQTLYIL